MELGSVRQRHIHVQTLAVLVRHDVQVGLAKPGDEMLLHFLDRLGFQVRQFDVLAEFLEGVDLVLGPQLGLAGGINLFRQRRIGRDFRQDGSQQVQQLRLLVASGFAFFGFSHGQNGRMVYLSRPVV